MIQDSPGGQSPVSTLRPRHHQVMGSRSTEHDHLTPNAQPKGRRVSKLGELNVDLICLFFSIYN